MVYVNYGLQRCNPLKVLQGLPTFRRNILFLSSRQKYETEAVLLSAMFFNAYKTKVSQHRRAGSIFYVYVSSLSLRGLTF